MASKKKSDLRRLKEAYLGGIWRTGLIAEIEPGRKPKKTGPSENPSLELESYLFPYLYPSNSEIISEPTKKPFKEDERDPFESTSLEDLIRIRYESDKREESSIRIFPSQLSESTGMLSKYLGKNMNIMNSFEEKNIIKEYYKNININKFIKNEYKNINLNSSGITLRLEDSAQITAENIAEFALPLVEYIHQTQPDYVVACDRGARLFGLAIYGLYRKLHGSFPTVDGTMRFRRFSKSNPVEATEKHVKPLIEEMLRSREKPTVFVVDDWIASGGTQKLVRDIFYRLGKGKINVRFGVLTGGGADVSGHNYKGSFANVTDWRDNSNIIGVSYGGYFSGAGVNGEPVRSEQAKDYRRRMYEGVNVFAKELKNSKRN